MGARRLESGDVIHLPTSGIDAMREHLRRWTSALGKGVEVDLGLVLDEERLTWLRSTPLAELSPDALAEGARARAPFLATTGGRPPDLAAAAEAVARAYLDNTARRLLAGEAAPPGVHLSPGRTYGIRTHTTLNALRDAQPRARLR